MPELTDSFMNSRIKADAVCPKCGCNFISYRASAFGNENATLEIHHEGGAVCKRTVTLLDAHCFEAHSKKGR